MLRGACLLLILLVTLQSFGQSQIKAMFYNVLDFSSAPPSNRIEILNSILSTYQPDLFMVCEVESQRDANLILTDAFQYTSTAFQQTPFLFNTSGASLIHQLVYYNEDKFSLDYTQQIETNVRSINHYSFRLLTNSSEKLEVFVAHFKASRGQQNVAERAFEAQQFINYIKEFPHDTNILLAGDFNMYSASEIGYQSLLNGTETIKMIDPIDAPGDWNNNETFADIHTQSTRTSSFSFDGFGAGGGLDDRFDIMLISDVMTSKSNSISYIENSYEAYGNNGNCLNKSINNLDCNGDYSQELREWLYLMSDHLPVVMELSVKDNFLSTLNSTKEVPILKRTLVSNQLEIKLPVEFIHKKGKIFNLMGQEIKRFDLNSKELNLDISEFLEGLYFLQIESYTTSIKFYKKL